MLELRRVTSGSSWIPQIDGLRFVAIAAVVLGHTYTEVSARGPRPLLLAPEAHPFLSVFITYCTTIRGVELFFVISGYILARPFLRQYLLAGHPVRAGAYYLRRITRLEPPYILSLLIYTFAVCLGRHESFRSLLPHLLASVGYVHGLVYDVASTINFVCWSLEIEVQFYILAPLLGNIYRVRNTSLRRSIIALLMLAAMLMNNHLSTRFVFGYIHYFFAGFLLADLLEYPRHAPRRSWWWDLVSLVGWPVFVWSGINFPTYLVLFLLPIFLAAFHGKASNWFYRQTFIAITGGMCYSLYLMHFLVVESLFRGVEHIQLSGIGSTLVLQMTLILPMVILVCTGFFVLIERPCMDPAWPQKLWRRMRDLRNKESGACVDV
jgi:peptidoglycan/LPS O-acetylase OafA/YrhL